MRTFKEYLKEAYRLTPQRLELLNREKAKADQGISRLKQVTNRKKYLNTFTGIQSLKARKDRIDNIIQLGTELEQRVTPAKTNVVHPEEKWLTGGKMTDSELKQELNFNRNLERRYREGPKGFLTTPPKPGKAPFGFIPRGKTKGT